MHLGNSNEHSYFTLWASKNSHLHSYWTFIFKRERERERERQTPSSSFQIAKKTFKRHFAFPSNFLKILILNVKTNTIINFIIVVLHGHPTAHKARITKQNGGTISFATNHSFWGPSKWPMWVGFGIWQWVEPMQVDFKIFYWGRGVGWGVASDTMLWWARFTNNKLNWCNPYVPCGQPHLDDRSLTIVKCHICFRCCAL